MKYVYLWFTSLATGAHCNTIHSNLSLIIEELNEIVSYDEYAGECLDFTEADVKWSLNDDWWVEFPDGTWCTITRLKLSDCRYALAEIAQMLADEQ